MSKFFKVNVSAVIFNGDKVLIQKRSQDEEVFPSLWGIPGGTVEITDKDLNSALEREVREETGIEIQNLLELKNNIRAKELFGIVYIVYSSDYSSGEPTAMEGSESVAWMGQNEIENLEFTPTIKETIKFAYARKNIADSPGTKSGNLS